MWELCYPSPFCNGELPLYRSSFDNLLQFGCIVSATVRFLLTSSAALNVALELQQLFFRVDVKGKLNSLPKSLALHMCFLKPYWQLQAIFEDGEAPSGKGLPDGQANQANT